MKGKKKYSLLKSSKHRLSRDAREAIDYDYLDKLSEEEFEWLSKFTDIYLYGRGSDAKEWLMENDDNIETEEQAQAELRKSYNRNNCRKRDVRNYAKFSSLDNYVEQGDFEEACDTEELQKRLWGQETKFIDEIEVDQWLNRE